MRQGTKLTPKLTLGVTSYCNSLVETSLSMLLKNTTTTKSDFFTTDAFWRKTKFNILVQFFIFSFLLFFRIFSFLLKNLIFSFFYFFSRIDQKNQIQTETNENRLDRFLWRHCLQLDSFPGNGASSELHELVVGGSTGPGDLSKRIKY